MPDATQAAVIAIVCLAVVFDYSNGFHDAANSIATVVSTRVLNPRLAVVWAAFFNFVAFLVFKTHVANTIGTIIEPSVVSEAVGFAGLGGAIALMWVFRRSMPRRVDRLFRRLQLVSAAAFSLGHGSNDAQKTMGIISVLLVGAGYLHLNADGSLPVPFWVVLLAQAAIALGTLSGGWRIVKTLGQRITALKPIGGFSPPTGAAPP